MDVFYYWKNIKEDRRDDRIGHLRLSLEQLQKFQEGAPDYIWAFKTPKGQKGHVQLHARLRWLDEPGKSGKRRGETCIHYDPLSADSVRYTDSGSVIGIESVTNWLRTHIPTAIGSNFQGANGQHAMRGAVVSELRRIASTFEAVQFMSAENADQPPGG